MRLNRSSHFLLTVSFKHTATPVLFADDPGDLASDEDTHSESYSAVNAEGGGVLREQVGELRQVVSQLCLLHIAHSHDS